MDLFRLPPELVHLVFDHIVTSRPIERVVRIRIVSRQFKTYIDDSIFRIGLLNHFIGRPIETRRLIRHTYRPMQQASRSYIHSYVEYRVLREHSTTSPLGRIRRAAKALCKTDGNTGIETILAHTKSLIPLAIQSNPHALLRRPQDGEPDRCSYVDLKADIYVAAVYLGKHSYVESLIADGLKFCEVDGDVHSTVFGDAFHAATIQGDVDMIKLLLSCVALYRDKNVLPNSERYYILWDAGLYGHQAAFDFALNSSPSFPICVLPTASTLENFERAIAIMEPDFDGFNEFDKFDDCHLDESLLNSICQGNIPMVQYFLDRDDGWRSRGGGPPLTKDTLSLDAAIGADNETITRMVLDARADTKLYPAFIPIQLLMQAAWKGNRSIVKLLLSRYTDINQGHPPPIVIAVFKENMDMFRLLRNNGARLDTPETGGLAMAVAKLHGLSSMVDVLVREGVGQDIVLHSVPQYRDLDSNLCNRVCDCLAIQDDSNCYEP